MGSSSIISVDRYNESIFANSFETDSENFLIVFVDSHPDFTCIITLLQIVSRTPSMILRVIS